MIVMKELYVRSVKKSIQKSIVNEIVYRRKMEITTDEEGNIIEVEYTYEDKMKHESEGEKNRKSRLSRK